ncbi:MAG: hypothetical protein AB9882_06165 [Ignavibacteriaceae bacterium]
MAKLKNFVFGKASGKLGPVVFRVVRGQQYIVQRPSSYTTSNSELALFSRNRLVSLVKFSSFLNKNKYIKQFWHDESLIGWSPYHRILNYNSPRLLGPFISPNNSVVPLNDLEPVKSVSFSENTLTVTLHENIFDPVAAQFRLDLVIVLTQPCSGTEQLIACFSLFREISGNEFTHSFVLDDEITSRFSEFGQMIVFPLFSFQKEGHLIASSRGGTSFTLPLSE